MSFEGSGMSFEDTRGCRSKAREDVVRGRERMPFQSSNQTMSSCRTRVCHHAEPLQRLRERNDNGGGHRCIWPDHGPTPKTWYKEAKRFFTQKCKMQNSQRDPALFYKGKREDAVVVAVYVDDMTIAGKEEKVLEIKRKIAEE